MQETFVKLQEERETLDSFITKDENYKISKVARFNGFKFRAKVELLKFFVV
jgi:hypothetical protein